MKLISGLRRILALLLIMTAVFLLVSGCAETDAARERELESLKEIDQQIKAEEKQPAEAAKKTVAKQDKDSLMEDKEEPPEGKAVEVFNTNNINGTENGGTPTKFTLAKKYYITKLGTYHWERKGTGPGTIGIKAADGKMYGPWKAKLDQEVYWRAEPNAYIPAGSYTVVDSDPSTWAQNAESGGQGMAWASGIPVK